MSGKPRVAVLGAGPSGLAVLRAFHAAGSDTDIVCFEKQADVGGLWLYDWRTGAGLDGEPVHGSMYRFLWSNGPKECLDLTVQFADYSFLEHFGRPIPSYPPREVVLDYIRGRLLKQGAGALEKSIRFRHAVHWVSWDEQRAKFSVRACNLLTGDVIKEDFDYVVCATGHYSTPNVPQFAGIETFPGRVLHAHDFRSALEFKGQRVLLIGASYSAEDIGSQCLKYGARSVSFCYRTAPMRFTWPAGITTHALLQRVEQSTCRFADGSSGEFDAIVLCTGYLNHYPFMDEQLRLRTRNRLNPPNLFHGVFWNANPRLMYLGMQDQYYTFNMFDLQAWIARDFILGKLALPPAAEREVDMRRWIAREEAVAHYTQAIDFQTEYLRSLLPLSDYPPFDLDAVAAMFKLWEKHKEDDIMAFRDRAGFKSAITGTVSPAHHTPWLHALDDSMASYLAPPQ